MIDEPEVSCIDHSPSLDRVAEGRLGLTRVEGNPPLRMGIFRVQSRHSARFASRAVIPR